jgi:hypothetical protein
MFPTFSTDHVTMYSCSTSILSFFFCLAIVLSVFLEFTDSDYRKSTHFRLFRGGRQTVKNRTLKIVTKDYLCQSLIVVTSTQHVNFSYSLHDQCGVFLSSVFCELFILCKMYTIYLIIGILYRYIMFGRGICEKYKSHGEGNLVSSLVFFASTPPMHDISV